MAQSKGVPADKGSKKWIQKLVNENPALLNARIAKQLRLSEDDEIKWLSPLENNAYREYYDQESLSRLGLELKKVPLASFWPKGGPHWDALGKTEKSKKVLLVEAKSHIREMISTVAAGQSSLPRIRKSLIEAMDFLGANTEVDPTVRFYQFANRLAHLYLLRQLNDVPAYLIYVYFMNDDEMHGPTSEEEWQGALRLLSAYMGLGSHRLQKYIAEIFVDVRQI